MVSRGIHDAHPNRQRELASKCAAINLLRLIETCPNGAGEIGIIPANSASVKSSAVPVLPAAGIFFRPNSVNAAFPVPDSSASARQECTSYAVSGLVTTFRRLAL